MEKLNKDPQPSPTPNPLPIEFTRITQPLGFLLFSPHVLRLIELIYLKDFALLGAPFALQKKNTERLWIGHSSMEEQKGTGYNQGASSVKLLGPLQSRVLSRVPTRAHLATCRERGESSIRHPQRRTVDVTHIEHTPG